jgi:hypothetical protein
MNEFHENNLDRDPFADDAKRRPSRLRRTVAREARRSERLRCAAAIAGSSSPSPRPIRHARPCPHAARGPLR